MGTIKKLAPGIDYASKSMALIEVSQRKVEPDAIGLSTMTTIDEWSRWGIRNQYPLEILDKTKKDPVSMRALEFKSTAHYGKGPQLYRRKFEDGKKILEPVDIAKYPEIDDFFFENNIPNFLQSITQDYEWWNRYHVEYITNKPKTKIIRINSGIEEEGTANYLRTKDIRKAKRDKETGKIKGFYVSGDWTEAHPKTAFVNSFKPTDPFRFSKAMYEHKRTSIANDYYITPSWWASMRWLDVTSKIPEWINSNIDHSVNIKYHIHIPEKYFLDLYPQERYKSDEEWHKALEEAEAKLKQKLDNYLAGEKNVNKAFYSKFAVDDQGNILPGWKIEKVENDIKDEAWLNADQTASVRILTAHGVDPTLAGIVIGNTSAGSGSDVREKFNFHMQLNTQIGRQTTTEWFEFVKRINGWERDLELGYENLLLDTLNNTKTGYKVENEMNPTAENK